MLLLIAVIVDYCCCCKPSTGTCYCQYILCEYLRHTAAAQIANIITVAGLYKWSWGRWRVSEELWNCTVRCSSAAVLNSSPRAPPLCIYCMSLLVNTPDSYNQLVRSALRAWTVFRLTCSLHSVHCSLLPEQGKSVEVYFTSEHSLMDLRCATSSRTDECDIIYVCKYIQFKFTSRTLQCTMNGIRSLWTGIMEEYRVMSTSQGTYDRLEQTSEVIRVT